MTWINAILSMLLVLGLIAVALGYRHSLMRRERTPEFYFALSKVLIAMAFAFRLLWWDGVWNIMRHIDRDAAHAVSDAIGGVNSNIVSILIGLAGVYASLRARQLLLREEERVHWPWFLAWAHPSILGLPRRRH